VPSTRIRFALGIACAIAALATPAAALADDPPAPGVTTAAATDVTATTATFHAKVVTNGTPTTAYFAYGTAPDQLTRRTAVTDVGTAPGEIPLDVPVTGLTANTKYYVVGVAENDDWEISGDAVTLTTLQAPEILSGTISDITYKSATLHLNVATHGQPTTITGSVGKGLARIARPGVNLVRVLNGTPFGPVAVSADGDVAIPLAGLEPGTNYYWSADAKSVAGTGDNGGGPFRTTALFLMPRPSISPSVAPYGSHLTIQGKALPGLVLTLAEQPYPFLPSIVPLAGVTATAGPDGSYAFDLRAERSARYGVLGEGAAPLAPISLTRVRVAAVVAAKLKRARHHRFVVSGRYQPGVVGKASLYRIGAGRVGVAQSSTSGAFRFPARALRPGRYEVRVAPLSTTGYVPGKSATVIVPKRR